MVGRGKQIRKSEQERRNSREGKNKGRKEEDINIIDISHLLSTIISYFTKRSF